MFKLIVSIAFFTAIAIAGPVDTWSPYQIAEGDTLSKITGNDKGLAVQIENVNNLDNNNLITGKTLMVPCAYIAKWLDDTQLCPYTVVEGNTIGTIANNVPKTMQVIKVASNLDNIDIIDVGQKLSIPCYLLTRPKCTYKIKEGDTLGNLATVIGESVTDLASRTPQIENIDLIYPNQLIHVPCSSVLSGQ